MCWYHRSSTFLQWPPYLLPSSPLPNISSPFIDKLLTIYRISPFNLPEYKLILKQTNKHWNHCAQLPINFSTFKSDALLGSHQERALKFWYLDILNFLGFWNIIFVVSYFFSFSSVTPPSLSPVNQMLFHNVLKVISHYIHIWLM